MLAISTTWKYNPHTILKGFLAEIKDLGLDSIEVGYDFTPERLDELASLLANFAIKIASVHNFCPLSGENLFKRFYTDYYRLSSLNEDERSLAVLATKKTIDTALRLGARIVVIHAGVVEIDRSYTRNILSMYRDGKAGTKEYENAKEELLRVRDIKKVAYVGAVIRSLEEILAYAKMYQIKIGLECRYYPEEIPNLEEADYLLKMFSSGGLVYWHDMGHAQVQENLGFVSHLAYLERLSGYLYGFHVHDVQGLHDHMAPFTGMIDMDRIMAYMKPDTLRVIEAHPPASIQEIKNALVRLSV
ncbi:MAG: sugar phosphate isomerase/epimerase family protein [Candidatus Omnitrophota bacterium]